MEQQAATDLRLMLQATEDRERQLQNTLREEKLSGQAMTEKLQKALRLHEDGERDALEACAASQAKELQFVELQEETAALRFQCESQDKALRESSSEFDALQE